MEDKAVRSASSPECTIYPLRFSLTHASPGAEAYLCDRSTRRLIEFFEAKGIRALKQEDRAEQWYEDWLSYQNEHRIYASLLTPNSPSRPESYLDVRRLTRF